LNRDHERRRCLIAIVDSHDVGLHEAAYLVIALMRWTRMLIARSGQVVRIAGMPAVMRTQVCRYRFHGRPMHANVMQAAAKQRMGGKNQARY
jgi:hypothetical protein